MTCDEFNKKWKDYLEERHYGMSICDDDVIDYMDKEFEEEVKINPNFSYSQIKTKFNWVCVYAESDKCARWEMKLTKMLKEKEYLD